MGTRVEVWSESTRAWQATRDLFEEVEQVASRFRPDSELSRVNQDARERVTVTSLLGDLLACAVQGHEMTDGLVDAGVGAAMPAWGYDRTFAEIEPREVEPSPLPPATWRYDPRHRVLTRPRGVMIDLGGIAKGWTADLAVETGRALVVSAGGDIRSAHPDTVVKIDDGAGGIAASVCLGVGGLASSSTAHRSWRVGRRTVSHLIDPRNGRPVDSPVIAATATAGTAFEAELAAKVVLILGEDGLRFADRAPWVRSALAIWYDGSVYATSGLAVTA